MQIGVVSDTHNNLKNIEKIISLFNREKVSSVVHTGDISNAKSLEKFKALNCRLTGVFGNNDRDELSLKEFAEENDFLFQEPPVVFDEANKQIAIFHEPDLIESFLKRNNNIDIVLHGHTHRYRMQHIGNTLVFNPGESAGMIEGSNAIGIVDLKTLLTRRIFF